MTYLDGSCLDSYEVNEISANNSDAL